MEKENQAVHGESFCKEIFLCECDPEYSCSEGKKCFFCGARTCFVENGKCYEGYYCITIEGAACQECFEKKFQKFQK